MAKKSKERELNELEQILNDPADAAEFMDFRDKKKRKENARSIEVRARELMEEDESLKLRSDKLYNQLNKLYREAWGKACAELNFNTDVYPSKW